MIKERPESFQELLPTVFKPETTNKQRNKFISISSKSAEPESLLTLSPVHTSDTFEEGRLEADAVKKIYLKEHSLAYYSEIGKRSEVQHSSASFSFRDINHRG